MPTQIAPAPSFAPAEPPTLTRTVDRAVIAGVDLYGDLDPDRSTLRQALARLPSRASRDRGAELYLVAACEQGVEAAWNALWRTHLKPLAPVAARTGLSIRDAQEVVVELFSELWIDTLRSAKPRGLVGFHGIGPLTGWLSQIVRRRAFLWLRQRRNTATAFEPDSLPSDESTDPLTRIADAEEHSRDLETIHRRSSLLSSREATVVSLKYHAGLSQSAIARKLQIGEPRVSRIHRRALSKLQPPHSLAI